MKKLVIEFESKEDMENWKSWYINAGEQDARYYTNPNKSNKKHLYVERDNDYFMAIKIKEEYMLWFNEKNPKDTLEERIKNTCKKYNVDENWLNSQF